MFSRRNFLRLSALATAGFAAGKARALSYLGPTGSGNKGPVILSTWRYGVPANKAAWEVIQKGGQALDAVETGVRVTEADPGERSVGLGGRPDRDGRVTLDACIMDDKMNIGAVAFLEHIVHPISVARAVMEKTPHAMLVGEGALQFALSQGYKKENLLVPESEKDWREWLKRSEYLPEANIENHDTIGMIAMDQHGNLSGACTTSGLAWKMHGRVGDSPIIGAGLYVDNEIGAAVATGVGEEVIRVAGSHAIVELMRHGKSPEAACKEVLGRIVEANRRRGKSLDNIQVGFLAINKQGEHAAFALRRGFNFAHSSTTVAHNLVDAPYLLA